VAISIEIFQVGSTFERIQPAVKTIVELFICVTQTASRGHQNNGVRITISFVKITELTFVTELKLPVNKKMDRKTQLVFFLTFINSVFGVRKRKVMVKIS